MKGNILWVAMVIIGAWACHIQRHERVENDTIGMPEPLTFEQPEKVGLSPTKILKAANLFKTAIDSGKVLGYQILVARKGKIVLHEAGGLRDYENGLPMEKNSLLNVASNTKSLTAVAILKLADEGKLSIDDPVSIHLPGFNSGQSNKITIKQLLLHQGGYLGFSLFYNGLTPYSPEEPEAPSLKIEAKELGLAGPDIEPGTMFRYSNLGYNVLAAIIEEISQMKLNQYFAQHFYKPLDMTETVHLMKNVDSSRLCKQYYYQAGRWELMDMSYAPIARGNGGTISTALDFARFFQMLANGGVYNNHRILLEESVKLATSPLLKVSEAYLSEEVEKEMGLPSSEWYEYRDARKLNIDRHRGYGFVVSNNGGFAHAGIFGTYAYADPKNELVIIIFTQSIYGGNPGQEFIETVYSGILDSLNL